MVKKGGNNMGFSEKFVYLRAKWIIAYHDSFWK